MNEAQVVGGMALSMQIGTAAYALRLNRLFGSERTGWALFGVFAILLVLHVTEALVRSAWRPAALHLDPQFVYLAVSGLLLIGLTHVGVFLRTQLQAERLTGSQVERAVLERTRHLTEEHTHLEEELAAARQAEAQLRTDQLQSVSRLAGGVAHHFNNLLTIIQGTATAHLITDDLPPSLADSLRHIQAASERAALLTRDLLAVGQLEMLDWKSFDLNPLLLEAAPQWRCFLGDRILVSCHTCPRPARLRADPAAILRVLMKLALHARETMPAGGEWTVRTSLVDGSEIQDCPSSGAERYACVEATDNGCGLAPDVLQHLFEPFPADSDLTKGVGLHLAAAHGLVRQHGGCMQVTSRLGHGTRFRIYLPSLAEGEVS